MAERTRPRVGAALLVALLASAGCAGDEKGKPERDRWTVPGEPPIGQLTRPGAFGDPRLREASGAVPSTGEAGVFWSQNDSGNEPTLFAYDSTGAARGMVTVRGATNTDWEAIAVGPCASGRCLYIGDVGDNYGIRSNVRVWRLPEPTTNAANTETAALLRVAYPDGARDVEAMWVAPDTSVWLATKRPDVAADGRPRSSRLYRVPASAWTDSGGAGIAMAEFVDSLPIVPGTSSSRDWITDASLSAALADGRRQLVVLTYGSVYVFEADPATGRPGAQLGRCALPPRDRHAEGITWLPDGRFMIVSEGRKAKLYRGRCP